MRKVEADLKKEAVRKNFKTPVPEPQVVILKL
jgi:hypothetical protein